MKLTLGAYQHMRAIQRGETMNTPEGAYEEFCARFPYAETDDQLRERIRELRGRGLPTAEAIRDGALTRVRPVVMTALMAALGLLPMALSTAVGAETSRPFAVVIIGGLITATLVTLFILPLLYPWFEPETQTKPDAPSI